MKGRICSLLLVILALTASAVVAWAATVEKRAPLVPPTQTFGYVAPTPNLTAVANALTLRSKSLTTVVSAPPGLSLTNPVSVKVKHKSPYDEDRGVEAYYDLAKGYRNFHHDRERGGQPRRITLEILLTERQPGNQYVPFGFNWQVDLDPLFDVSLSPLRFTLMTDCGAAGNKQIRFMWYAPERQLRYKDFSTSKGQPVQIDEFAWARQEVSASASLVWPIWGFGRMDAVIASTASDLPGLPIPLKPRPLVPDVSGQVSRSLKELSGQPGCEANTNFEKKFSVRQYPNL